MNEVVLSMRGPAEGKVCAEAEESRAKAQHFHFK